ncbi:UDP-N-ACETYLGLUCOSAMINE--peptide N-ACETYLGLUCOSAMINYLtransferase [Teratosphaeria nubilosa]|uniref:protein O-GlcNAc transferase n=1 Tax=Teratosphaeria nubilosa TaxID=161662 RepID=A0A6G1LHC1_9PEZI|nr:UDP-N-ACETYLGLUCOSAMINE--peptide N-ACETYLGLUCOSAMINYLtransferase [Teratosphaeria nubilosa]
MPYLSHQYALPILRRNSGDYCPGSGESTPRPDNTLRRKTPNGTLHAGYEIGPVEDTNPQKHQLLFSKGTSLSHQYADPAITNKRTFLEHHQAQQSNQAAWNGGFGWQGSQYGPPPSMPVMDSMLHQMPMYDHCNAQQYFNQTVPSVIQPSFQYLGPTASGGQGSGPYGPYWHDGTYVPYRPAALRDPRFYHQPSYNYQRSLPSSQLAQQGQLWNQQYAAPQSTPWPLTHGYGAPSPPIVSQHGLYASPFSSVPLNAYGSNAAVPVDPQLWADSGHTQLDLESEYGPSSPYGRQRDKTFQWALQQYRELLAFIQHNRRQQQHGRQGHSMLRPTFYPRPPRPSSESTFDPSTRRATTHNQGADQSFPGDVVAARGSKDDSALLERANGVMPSLWSPSGVQFRDDEYQRRASYDQWSYQAPGAGDHFRTLRGSSGLSVSPIITQPPVDDTPHSRARMALQYMTTLCQASDWKWTDGLLLGGCLAYGLSDYHKALRWYNRVLDTEKDHLEATSNMAATLLALGRRQEAEQNWMKVIKAAPNHFEAVEHLIGLLCIENRSGDAIRVIEYVERCLRQSKASDQRLKVNDKQSECSSSTASRSPCRSDVSDKPVYDFEADGETAFDWKDNPASSEPGFGSSGFAIAGADNGRILALIHAKGNMLYGLGDNAGAARAFEDAVLIAAGRRHKGIQGLVTHILAIVSTSMQPRQQQHHRQPKLSSDPILLAPEQALATAKLCFPHSGELPGLQYVAGTPQSLARRAVVSTTSNSLLSLAKIFQDGMSTNSRSVGITPLACGVRDILALYYLSLSLQPSPSTANNVGILLASVQQAAVSASMTQQQHRMDIPGVIPGSGIALALQYYNYGLQLDATHAHLYTNLGSLLKDIGQLDAAIQMYERAVKCDGKFDIALANLANAVKDKSRISDAIGFYKRAVEVNPDFAEAVCGLANALNSVCSWTSRGGIADDGGKRDRWHVDGNGMLLDASQPGATSSGWIKRVVDIVEKQLVEGENWGSGILTPGVIEDLTQQMIILDGSVGNVNEREHSLRKTLEKWAGQKWEGARVTRLVERAVRRIGWHWYRDTYVRKKTRAPSSYNRPQLPVTLTVPTAPTVLPFHTFTCPMSAQQIRLISQRNGLRISVSALRAPWLPKQVYPPPKPPNPVLNVGYVSSDFNNHPLAHLMQSVFGLHNAARVKAFCYATTASDNSPHRKHIEAEAPAFRDASTWSTERLVNQIVTDNIHILVNLNGYTRGARNEVFAARPAPIQMSFMGFAGTLGAEWCDYLLADETAVPRGTLRPWRRNIDLEDQMVDETCGGEGRDWVYGENIIYCRDTFFCCDHKQSAPDAKEKRKSWDEEQKERWRMRQELFPQISDDTIIFGNFNQLYKIDPTTFRTWLRILARVPKSILWLLRFPDLGESHLLSTARLWAGQEVASRVIFTDVAPKHLHISRARICDIVLDTAECNAHTTAADVLWSGTPLLTLPRYSYKMCSRMAASILKGALPKGEEGARAAKELIATSEDDYEEKAVALAKSLTYTIGCKGRGEGRLTDLRKMLFQARWSSALFDTKRWVSDLEDAYEVAWAHYVKGEGGDIWLEKVRRGTGRDW